MTAEFHKANRQRLYAEMKDGSAAVFFSGSAPRQSADAYYTFFTNRNFLYLTGIKFAGLVLVATKSGGNVQESIYILPPDLMKAVSYTHLSASSIRRITSMRPRPR